MCHGQLDEEIRRDEAMMMKRVHDSRMKTENAIREIRLEQERRLIKEEHVTEHKQRHKEMQSAATACQENERIKDETEEKEQRRDAERGNDHTTCIEQNETSDKESETKVHTGYTEKSHEEFQSIDGTKQSDYAHASLSNLKIHHYTDPQKKAMQRTLQMYSAQECAAEVPRSVIQLGILIGDSEVGKIVYAAFRDIVISSNNSSLCFKFLWWQEGTLSS